MHICSTQLTAVLGLCAASLVQAESTLVFETVAANGAKSQQTISITGRWLRSETEPKGKADYALLDSGRLMLFNVDDKAQNYRVTRVGKIFWPEAPPAPKFIPTKKKQSVAGVPCIIVQEVGKEGPVAEHCMAGIGPLGLNRRELIALSRLFMAGRNMGTGEVGVATADERQLSIQSRSLDGKQSRVLKSVTLKPTPDLKLKIPDEYKRIKPDLPRNPTKDPEKFKKLMQPKESEKPQTAKPEKTE